MSVTLSPPARTLLPAAILPVLILAGIAAGAFQLNRDPAYGTPAALSLLLGAVLGVLFQRGRFCFHCILRDLMSGGDSRPAMALVAALVAGGLGYAVVIGAWVPDPARGALPPDAHIGPVSWVLVLAGAAFGAGMVLSGSCISGHLYRLGEGSTRAPFAIAGSLLGFALGFFTWDTLYLAAIADAPSLWLPRHLGYAGALALHLIVLGALALWLWLRSPLPATSGAPADPPSLRRLARRLLVERWSPGLTGAAIGLIGVAAYLRVEPLGVTAQLGSVSRTLAHEAGVLEGRLLGLDRLAGCATQVVQTVTDNGWLVGGLVLGALAAALAGGHWRPALRPPREYATATLGGILLGWGAMTALGCTVGTLLSGISAFAVSGWVFAAAMIAAVWIGLRITGER